MLRIRKTRWKALYIGIVMLVTFFFNAYVFPWIFPYPVDAIAGTGTLFALYLVGARVFRGRAEPVEPPRDWWRMTSKPKAGFLIGSLQLVSAANEVGFLIFRDDVDALTLVLNLISDLVLAVLYFHSSRRLVRYPPLTVPQQARLQKWPPIR